jgi:hypothetical protein
MRRKLEVVSALLWQSDPECQTTFFERVRHDVKVVASYVRWIQKHSVRVKSFCVVGSLHVAAQYLQNHGKHVTRIEFTENFTDDIGRGSCKQKLERFTQNCPNVTHFACTLGFGTSNMKIVVHSWPLLQEVTLLEGCHSQSVMLIAQCCHNMRSFAVFRVRPNQMSKRAWFDFFTSVNANLRHMRCDACIGNKALLHLTQRCTQLRTLQGRFQDITNEVLNEIATHCPLIENFAMKSHGSFSAGLIRLAQKGHLRALTTTWAPADALQLSPLLRRLKFVDLPVERIWVVMKAVAAHCSSLIELSLLTKLLQYNEGYDALLAAIVQNCPLLETLDVNLSIGPASLTALGTHCHELRALRLECFSYSITDGTLTALAQGCPKLRHLTLHCAHGGDVYFAAGITALAAHCPHLRKVYLDCPLYDEEGEYVTRVGKLLVVDEILAVQLPFYEAFAPY